MTATEVILAGLVGFGEVAAEAASAVLLSAWMVFVWLPVVTLACARGRSARESRRGSPARESIQSVPARCPSDSEPDLRLACRRRAV
jgi:hypothetical protein